MPKKSDAQASLREKQTGNALRREKERLSAAAAERRKSGVGSSRRRAETAPDEGTDTAQAPLPPGALGTVPEQEILDTIVQAFDDTLSSEKNFSVRLQAIKADFFHRRYNEIFDCPGNLPVYAVQYVPARALAYYRLLLDEPALFTCISEGDCRVVVLGGGSGSELVGFLAASTHVRAGCGRRPLNLTVLDRADWSDVHARLLAAAESRWRLADDLDMKTEFALADMLDLKGGAGAALKARLEAATLVTAMFVLNELMAVSRPKTMALIALLGSCLTRGTKLLVVDSAGSISNLQVNGNTYFLYMILDHVKTFRPIVADDSRWYRLPKHLSYPLDCQNMRYFIRLYERV